jgi:UDP-N-acetylglucosamine 1-carboxyvinyltransferase
VARLEIDGGVALRGDTAVLGAKNAALPLMAASLLCSGQVELLGVPDIADVHVLADILRALGVRVEYTPGAQMRLDASHVTSTTAPYELVRRMNASFDVAGPLLARFGEAHVALPGGCNLGQRRVNLHIDAFRALGAEVHREHGMLEARATRLQGTEIFFPKISVGATKNAMMAASLAEGTTILENVACEPEIVDLAAFLKACGARIEGAGTPRISIQGVDRLHGTTHRICPDRIVAGTLLVMGAITRGEVTVHGVVVEHLESLLGVLRRAGQEVRVEASSVTVKGRPVLPVEVATAPHPGFATDLHPPLVALLVLGQGVSILHETIFDGRFMYVGELVRMGANIRVADHTAVITGVPFLAGAPVEACDIRAGGALIAAALAAEGHTSVGGLELIDRGYQAIHEQLAALGARIERIEQA